MSRPARALWIEIEAVLQNHDLQESRPARALWIEICKSVKAASIRNYVEAREGLVD